MPGNYGMKDQVEALRWVKENIVKFNGDPNQVTIAGGSSGSACVGFHMLSPLSKGLFHKAILQSGTPVCRWAVLPPGIPRKRANAAATIAGCNFNDSEGILRCLRKIPAQHLMDLHTKLFVGLLFQYYPIIKPVDYESRTFIQSETSLKFFNRNANILTRPRFSSTTGYLKKIWNTTISPVRRRLSDRFKKTNLKLCMRENHTILKIRSAKV